MIGTVRFGHPHASAFDAQHVRAVGGIDAHGLFFGQGVRAVEVSVHGDPHKRAVLFPAPQQRQAAEPQEQKSGGQIDIRFFKKGNFMIHRTIRKLTAGLLLTLLIISQCACTGQTQPSGASAKTSFGEDWLLNTYCTIQTFESGQEDLIREAFAYARAWENRLSRTIASSEIGQFNASQDGCAVREETAALLQDCRAAWEVSGGKLDVTLGAVTSLWDFTAEDPQVPDAAAIEEALPHTGAWDRIRLSSSDVRKEDPAICLDLGAVAKGYIADKTAEFLRGEGVSRAIVNLGGNVVFIGEKEDGSVWACGIEDPSEGGSEALIQDRGIVGTVRVAAGEGGQVSVVTSGTYERCFNVDGVTYHHVLDPATGYPVETDLLSATVTGPSSEWCDVYSTTCLLLGSGKAMALIEAQEGYEAVLILQDGSIQTTQGADFSQE